ncbi:MAG: cation diffusion facilitator family transporter [Pseudomonadota bacterium]
MSADGSTRAILYALFANGGIAIAKGWAAWHTNSGAMLAECIHSVADCANQGLLLLGMKRARRKPDEQHPLGYGKTIYFWSFLVAILLFSMGGMFSIYEGVHKLQHPEMPTSPWVAAGVLAVAIVLEWGSLTGALIEVNKIKGKRTFWRWFRESRQGELVVVVGEDLAALAGLVLALAAVLLTIYTGNPLYDALGTIAIGVVLVLVAVAVAIEVKGLLIGESTDPEVQAQMEAFLAARPEVARVYRVLTLQLGADVMVSVKARLREEQSAIRLLDDINAAEAAFRDAFPQVRWMFFEPDRRG